MAKTKLQGQATVTGPSRSLAAASLNVPNSVSIAVDTAYVATVGSGFISQGVYMMDNQSANTSSGEGTTELHTVGNAGQLIGFHVVPIDGEGGNGDTVVITGFTVSQGNVFTAAGQPQQQPPLGSDPPGTYWVGQLMNQGTQTYQIQCAVTIGQLQPVTYYINWDPFITAR